MYFEAFFESSAIDWKGIYQLLRTTTINTEHRSFQYKMLNNVLYLNKVFSQIQKS